MIDGTNIIKSPDEKWCAVISAHLGANVIKFQFEDEDVFIPLESEFQLREDPFIIGSPILLPANRTYKGEFEFQGKKYKLPINDSFNVSNLHGFLYSQEFSVIDSTTDSIVLEYTNSGEIYPFKFKITVKYKLSNEGLIQSYCIKNIDDIDIPFTFALHTTFKEPDSFMVPISFCQEKDEYHIPTGKYVELNNQEKLYSIKSPSKDVVISGYYKSCERVARVGYYNYFVSDNFDHWVLYNGRGKSGFLCVEPQCGSVNGLNIENGFRVLKPGCEEVFTTKISRII